MYKYVEDKVFLSDVRRECGKLMQELCHVMKRDYDIGARFYLVGSGGKNLVTQNGNEAVDLDYNLELVRCGISGCGEVKEIVRKAFNKVLRRHKWPDCQDSTSALTTAKRHFTRGNRTEFYIDIAIVYRDRQGNLYRLIHQKTGWTMYDRYYWNQVPNSREIDKKVERIKKSRKWGDVRAQYLKIKNQYLTWDAQNHPSFICYIEAVNNVYHIVLLMEGR